MPRIADKLRSEVVPVRLYDGTYAGAKTIEILSIFNNIFMPLSLLSAFLKQN